MFGGGMPMFGGGMGGMAGMESMPAMGGPKMSMKKKQKKAMTWKMRKCEILSCI
jgi:hypothetical protein